MSPISSERPLISVVMANFEAGDKIVHALKSVLAQSVADIEVIVSDDCSGDASLSLVHTMMAEDSRIRVVSAPRNGGPARCRNRALDMAQGDWIAIVDSDDIIHPERFERLLAVAEHDGADIVADDLMLFFEDGSPPRLMLGDAAESAFQVTAERWVLSGHDGSPALGYLKPMIRSERLGTLRYDETLRIGEDYDLVLRLLLDNARMVVVPEPYYLYRRHSGSISHRLSVPDMEAMVARESDLAATVSDSSLAAALERRIRNLRDGLAYEHLVAAIKGRNASRALSLLSKNPALLGRLWRSFSEGRRRRNAPPAPPPLSPTLILGAAGTPGTVDAVPSYVPPNSAVSSPSPGRKVWLELAARRGTGAMKCVPLDRAGQYAAGFIPEAEIAVGS